MMTFTPGLQDPVVIASVAPRITDVTVVPTWSLYFWLLCGVNEVAAEHPDTDGVLQSEPSAVASVNVVVAVALEDWPVAVTVNSLPTSPAFTAKSLFTKFPFASAIAESERSGSPGWGSS